MPGWDRDDSREVGVITGCLLLASMDTWRALGGFDPRFFMYGEDTDLSLRAWAAGYHPMITPEAEVVHTIGASSARTNRRVMIMKGKTTVVVKHWSGLEGRLMVALLAAGVGLRAGLDVAARAVRRGGAESEWAGTWRRRSEWLAGYPPVAADVATSAELAERWAPNSRSYTPT
jgi:GT2 family glycosyltransferase